MSNAKKMTAAERIGHTVGQWLKPVVRLESALVKSFVAIGVPRWLVLALKWVVRLAFAAGLLYISVIPVLIVLFLILLGSGGTEARNDAEWNQRVDIDYAFRKEQQDLEDTEQEDIELDEASRRGNDPSEWWQP